MMDRACLRTEGVGIVTVSNFANSAYETLFTDIVAVFVGQIEVTFSKRKMLIMLLTAASRLTGPAL